jgi:hypothetical protein
VTRQIQQLARVNELFRSTVELLAVAIRRGAGTGDLLQQIGLVEHEFEQLDQQNNGRD